MAVQGYSWATPCIDRINENTRFQNFYIVLSRSVQGKMVELESNILECDTNKNHIIGNESKPSIHFTQTRYGRSISTQFFPGTNK